MRTVIYGLNMPPARWLITLLWMVALTIVLLQPIDQQIIPTGVKPAPPSFMRELFFSTVHGIAFGITAILWTWTLHNHIPLRRAMWSAVILLFFYGLSTEWIQSQSPGRSAQLIDVLANVLGSVIGAWLIYGWITNFLRRITPTTLYQTAA